MYEYHGWATLRDTSHDWAADGAADDLSHAAYDAVVAAIAGVRNDWQVADLWNVNGSAHLWLAGLRNHRQDTVVGAFHTVARLAPWSYGLLHVYDDEVEGVNENRWVTWVMRRGSVTPQADTFLSPHIGVVEDEYL